MAKEKTKLVVVGNSNECSACKSEKAFIEKNKRKIKRLGIDEIVFVNPASKKEDDANLAILYQNKHIGGMKAQPLTVISKGSNDVAFLGFAKGKFIANVKDGALRVKEPPTKGKVQPKKKWSLFGNKSK